MKSDARLLLNKKKWKNTSGNQKADSWKKRGGTVGDARKILNLKRSQKSRTPSVGTFMRTKTATSLIASRIQKEIASITKVPDKRVQLSEDGNLIITSKSSNMARGSSSSVLPPRSLAPRSRIIGSTVVYEPPTSEMEDLEHTGIQDLLDIDSLPSTFVSPSTVHNTNLSRNSVVGNILNNRHTMVADQLVQSSGTPSAKVYVSNLHHTVSRQDIMELFGDVGLIKNAEILRPGTAIIDFYCIDDAAKACEIYHNRLLDGLPMKCFMQEIEAPQRPAIAQRLGEAVAHNSRRTLEPVIPVVSTNPRSRYNPRNVRFTVKLT